MTEQQMHDAWLLANAPARQLDEYDQQAEAQGRAINNAARMAPRKVGGGKMGKRDHGKAARPTAGSGSNRYSTMRLQRVG